MHKNLQKIILILGVVIVALVVFQVGVVVGYRRATFALQRDDNYYRGFSFGHGRPPNPHGISGTVVSVALPTIVIEGRDNDDAVVLVASTTDIRKGPDAITGKDVHPNDHIVVIGTPNDLSQIEARIIRILP